MSNDTLALLTSLAKKYKSRTKFNSMVADHFTKLGSGAFRMVFDAGTHVIKLRRASPKRGNEFSMEKIDAANLDEVRGYEKLKRNKLLAALILEPSYYCLPNGHDVIIMEKVDAVWGEMGRRKCDDVEKNNTKLHNQIQAVQMAFQDGHDNNVGIKGDRAYLIDVNFSCTWTLDDEEKTFIKNSLEAVGVDLSRKKRVKQVAAPLMAMAGAA